LNAFASHFARHRGERVVVEASPGYFSDGMVVAQEIRDVLGEDCKIIIVLREISRLLSSYNHAISQMQLDSTLSLEDYISLCRRLPSVRESRDRGSQVLEGYYGGFSNEPLMEWSEIFQDKLKVTFFDDPARDYQVFMVDLAKWLYIDCTYYQERELTIENASFTYKRQPLHRIANWLNYRMEPVLTRYPTWSRHLRHAYLRVNSLDPAADGLNAELEAFLNNQYGPSNRLVATFLKERGYKDLPPWLESAAVH
jgi:hypothetical protein